MDIGSGQSCETSSKEIRPGFVNLWSVCGFDVVGHLWYVHLSIEQIEIYWPS